MAHSFTISMASSNGCSVTASSSAPGRLSADYLGGIYSLNGYYPGFTGHALIANEVLELMNQPLLDLDDIAGVDPSTQIERSRRAYGHQPS